MMIPDADNDYVLELQIPAADELWLPDGGGVDRISALNSHAAPVEINLAYEVRCTISPYTAMAMYLGEDGGWHKMVILGVVENAMGATGSDRITGNELDNVLWGEADLFGLGAADTIMGGAGGDTLMGGGGSDLLSGGEGNDLMAGQEGEDSLLGGTGADTLEGGAGADMIDAGGDAGDTVSYAGSTDGIKLRLLAGGMATGLGGDAEGDQVSGARSVIGSQYRDAIEDEEKASLADGANAYAFFGGGGRDRLTLGGGDDTGSGDEGNDKIAGGEGADHLFGGEGDDSLSGGAGADSLSGGAGADEFDVLRPGDSAPGLEDWILDFSVAEGDRIDLSRLDAEEGVAGNQAFHLVPGGLTGQAGELAMLAQDAELVLMADTDGDGVADLVIRLLGLSSLTADSFLL